MTARCVCGHEERVHWRWGQVQGCGHHYGLFRPCRCSGYRPLVLTLRDALFELFECVARCECDWRLMDRIDRGIRVRGTNGRA